jgi:hypothetical protein
MVCVLCDSYVQFLKARGCMWYSLTALCRRHMYVSGTNLSQSRSSDAVPSLRLSRHLRFSGKGLFLSCEQPCIDMDLTCSISTSLDALSLSLPSWMFSTTPGGHWTRTTRGKMLELDPSLPFNSYVLVSAISFPRKRRRKHSGNWNKWLRNPTLRSWDSRVDQGFSGWRSWEEQRKFRGQI